MKNVFAASICLSASLLAAPTFAQSTSAPSVAASGQTSEGSHQMHQQMMGGMQKMQSMQPSGDTDRDFAMMMRSHHQSAVEMAQVELKEGKSPELKSMARKIIQAQKKEIAQFDKWLAVHK